MKLIGNLNGVGGWKMLFINVNRCTGEEVVCKSEAEIDQFLDGALFFTYTNDQEYTP